ncbi:hypothetical protein [Candidatus Uabimicrobium amorphum]|uniref:Uncharacterized protein n=1 Tax=Uabimicrobium amorphum TaxID=2596890 RepID=A0A5S9F2V3_UABAM|nr:hypothetical protein [Candidatus Uabimicrobium amorphum]BBM84006.1 hypothetical protein UABAM_02361 [Candidatus Uabimicrobium amorphum]
MTTSINKKNIIAQWAFDTRSILGRLHLWLEDVDEVWEQQKIDDLSFVEPGLERALVMTAAVTALGGKLFGRYGDGKGAAKKELNQVKKDADAITAYVMSESLWYLSRSLPENHAIMVCLGEGLMPKVGETPEMGSNPLLGFGRIYARPQVAKFLEDKVKNLINNDEYTWDMFYHDIKKSNITIWGAAIDTLENTSRFAKGKETGPLTIIHIFDQPLCMTKPYEGYMGNLIVPGEVQRNAQKNSLLLNFFTPREKVLDMILHSYPGLEAKNVHVWTLRGESRKKRIGSLWDTWEKLGVHLVDSDWKLPSELNAFTDSGTYKPCFLVKNWTDSTTGEQHVFICDGYAASAEAVQAASLSPLLDIHASIALFSSKFELSYEQESQVMHLNPESPQFASQLEKLFAKELPAEKIEEYKNYIYEAKNAGIPMNVDLRIGDFFPEKVWRVMGICGYILPDPYTGAEGVEQIAENIYRVTVRLATKKGCKEVKISLRLQESLEESQLVFNPLLTRFMNGENYEERAVKVSDSGRIRNELQTLCSEALEYLDNNHIKIYFNRIPIDVITEEKQKILKEVLNWYRQNHPIWFRWLECE